ncbi:hypothetical protein BHF71_03855 [Vulcanibacillus modesticaldus]|uniref:Pilus assembly protein PilZ n=1 Tax=Vulcanibacillus modesticaldus TaxID=337097 RepID=A0A1D2YSJ6_9BACI|nr:flagellar brake domain-containing protein [Vulcanibacillus modesticaldus]OEF97278.1 hypothetical protein BHF71_03855 [Vulcanibacillus modesticaldus]
MLPNINQLIEISLGDGEKFLYKSRVADVLQEEINIELPINKETGKIKLVPPGEEIEVIYFSNDQGQILFNTKVIGIKREQIPLLSIELPKDYKRIQRRNFLRVPASIETSYKIIGEGQREWNIVRTIDISGGGLQFVAPDSKKINLEQEIIGWLVVPFNNGLIEHIKYQGKIVRIHRPNEEVNVNWVSIKFTQIQENMRAKLIRFCYEKQVELKKKGVIDS